MIHNQKFVYVVLTSEVGKAWKSFDQHWKVI